MKTYAVLALFVMTSAGCMRDASFEVCATDRDCFRAELCQEGVCVPDETFGDVPVDASADMSADASTGTSPDMTSSQGDMEAPIMDDGRLVMASVRLPGPRSSAAHETPHLLVYRAEQDEGTLLVLWQQAGEWRERVVNRRLRWDESEAGERAMIHAYGSRQYVIVHEDVDSSGERSRMKVSFFDASRGDLSIAYDLGPEREAYTQSFDVFVGSDSSNMAFLLAHEQGVELIYSTRPFVWNNLDLDLGDGAYHTPRFIDAMTRLCAVSRGDELDCVNVAPLLAPRDDDDDEEDRPQIIRMLSEPGVAHYEFFSEKRDHILYTASGEPSWQQAKFKMDKEAESAEVSIEEQLDLAFGERVSMVSLEKNHDFVVTSAHRGQGVCIKRFDGETLSQLELDGSMTSVTSDGGLVHHFIATPEGVWHDTMPL